jgi:hypothetical protein
MEKPGLQHLLLGSDLFTPPPTPSPCDLMITKKMSQEQFGGQMNCSAATEAALLVRTRFQITFCPSSREFQLLPVKLMEVELCRCCSGPYLLVFKPAVSGWSFSATFLDHHLELKCSERASAFSTLRSTSGHQAHLTRMSIACQTTFKVE